MKASRSKSGHQQELTGMVVQKNFAPGSKSEHNAVCIETPEGDFKIRRKGGNPFSDPELTKLVGKKVTATGMLDQTIFFAVTIKIIS